MIRTYAKLVGFLLLVIGVLGFVPALTTDNMLLGIFHVNSPHNMVHLFSGVLLLAMGFSTNEELTRRVVLIFALVYGLIALAGFLVPNDAPVLGIPMNRADDVLHLTLAVSALMFGLPQRYPRVSGR